MFHLHTYIDYNEVDLYNIPYTTNAGRDISLSIAQLYISDIQLEKQDGSMYSIPGSLILKTLDIATYIGGDVPTGQYKSVHFKVGLAPATNALVPEESSHSELLNHPEMWFGSAAQPEGYIFLNVQGTIDTSSDFSSPRVPFVYKIGTNAHYKQVILPERNFTIVKDQAEYVHLMIDYSKIFNGIQINQPENLSVANAADNSSPLAEKIRDNIPLMFIYE